MFKRKKKSYQFLWNENCESININRWIFSIEIEWFTLVANVYDIAHYNIRIMISHFWRRLMGLAPGVVVIPPSYGWGSKIILMCICVRITIDALIVNLLTRKCRRFACYFSFHSHTFILTTHHLKCFVTLIIISSWVYAFWW